MSSLAFSQYGQWAE